MYCMCVMFYVIQKKTENVDHKDGKMKNLILNNINRQMRKPEGKKTKIQKHRNRIEKTVIEKTWKLTSD